MKSKTAAATIIKYVPGIHWYAIVKDKSKPDRWRKYMESDDARKYALRYVYAANIVTR